MRTVCVVFTVYYTAIGMDTDADFLHRSALHQLAHANDYVRLQAKIATLTGDGAIEAYINSRDVQHRTPLHYAVKSGSVACVAVLVGAGADPNLKDTNPNEKVAEVYEPESNTPLDFAVKQGDLLCTKMLLRSKLINQQTVQQACLAGLIARDAALVRSRDPLTQKIIFPHDDINQCLQYLIAKVSNADGRDRLNRLYERKEFLNSNAQYTYDYPLHAYVREGGTSQNAVDQYPNSITQQFRCYNTRPYDITRHRGTIRKYLSYINTFDESGSTPIAYAVRNNDVDMVQLLLEAGAAVGLTRLLFEAASMPSVAKNWYSITSAGNAADMIMDKRRQIIALLVRHGADINACDQDGFNLLHKAVYDNQKAAVEELLTTYKANLYAQDSRGNTVLHIAVCQEYTNLIVYLTAYENELRAIMQESVKKGLPRLADIKNNQGQTVDDCNSGYLRSQIKHELDRARLEGSMIMVDHVPLTNSLRDAYEDEYLHEGPQRPPSTISGFGKLKNLVPSGISHAFGSLFGIQSVMPSSAASSTSYAGGSTSIGVVNPEDEEFDFSKSVILSSSAPPPGNMHDHTLAIAPTTSIAIDTGGPSDPVCEPAEFYPDAVLIDTPTSSALCHDVQSMYHELSIKSNEPIPSGKAHRVFSISARRTEHGKKIINTRPQYNRIISVSARRLLHRTRRIVSPIPPRPPIAADDQDQQAYWFHEIFHDSAPFEQQRNHNSSVQPQRFSIRSLLAPAAAIVVAAAAYKILETIYPFDDDACDDSHDSQEMLPITTEPETPHRAL